MEFVGRPAIRDFGMFDWLFLCPATAWGLLLLLVMLFAAWVGNRLHHVAEKRIGVDPFNETQESYVVAAITTLLAFIIGFTFAIAVDRFEIRRQLVGEDARAIQELYLRAQMLEEPHRSRLSDILVRYADNRIGLAEKSPDDREAARATNDRLIIDIWRATIPAFESVRGIDFSSAFVDSANRVIEMHGARMEARNARIPDEVFFVTYVYLIVTAAVFGFVLQGRRGRIAGAILLVLSVMALMLVLDLNQPVSGAIRESQRPMRALSNWLHSNPPATFGQAKLPAAKPQARAPTPSP